VVDVGLEQLERLLDQLALLGDDREAAAADVRGGVVKAEQVQRLAVHDHDLVVVAVQVVVGAAHGGTGLEQILLELAQFLLTAAIGVRDQRADHDAAGRGRRQCRGYVPPVEPEDADVQARLGLVDRAYQRRDAVVRLDDDLQGPGFFSTQVTPIGPPRASSAAIASASWSVPLPCGTSVE
jgi:hypothetical protein